MGRLFGAAGLQVYVCLGVIAANLQVLKVVKFTLFEHPVALGTVVFASTYLCTDILAEFYGRKEASKAVWLGFASLLVFDLLMLLTLGFRPLSQAEAPPGLSWALGVHDHLAALFLPAPALLVAGMTAYLCSQHHDVWLYQVLQRMTGGRHLWLRNNLSTMLSALLDNTIFSVLAWVVLAPEPVGVDALVFTYILGTWYLRVLVAALDTPFVYLARWLYSRQATAGGAPEGTSPC
ncbi:MAG: hypothetical protein A2284_09705 [Deltaproteobacteria bacterium RIFOXYA12_FULL_61_11]|nr:MAG: hypothetical protein A2284_09705 [Deltaproteobacteria bacterium RIFOXYA12_FULL_61_11]